MLRRSVPEMASNRLRWDTIVVGGMAIVGLLFITGLFLIPMVPIVAFFASCIISILRLADLCQPELSGSFRVYDDNVKSALISFYSLVLAQDLVLCLRTMLSLDRLELARVLIKHYQFEDLAREKLVHEYISRTTDECIKVGVLGTLNKNMYSFASDLLRSKSREDQKSAVLALHTLISQDNHKARAVSKIQDSRKCISRLVEMLSPKNLVIDEETKACAADIIRAIGSNIRLTDMPRALNYISSQLDTCWIKVAATNDQTSSNNQNPNGNNLTRCPQLQGLVILEELACDPDNCVAIYNADGLVSKIITIVSNAKYLTNWDDISVKVVEASLLVLIKLASGTGETSRKLLQRISSNSEVDSISQILRGGNNEEYLKVPAIKILTKLCLYDSTKVKVDFIDSLFDLFFTDGNQSQLRRAAAEALVNLALGMRTSCAKIKSDCKWKELQVVQRLTKMLLDANNQEYQATAAQLLAQFCSTFCKQKEQKRSVEAALLHLLPEVLQVVRDVVKEADMKQPPAPHNAEQEDDRHNQGTFLRLISSLGMLWVTITRPWQTIARAPQNLDDESSSTTLLGMLQFLFPCFNRLSSSSGNSQDAGGGIWQILLPEPHTQENQVQVPGPALRPGFLFMQPLLPYLVFSLLRRNNQDSDGDSLDNHTPLAVSQNQADLHREKLLATFLDLAVKICEKINFADAATQVAFVVGTELVQVMKEIVERNNRAAADNLVIVKSVTKLCIQIMRMDRDHIQHFLNGGVLGALQDAARTMSGLENYMILTGSPDDAMECKTLDSLVVEAQQLIWS